MCVDVEEDGRAGLYIPENGARHHDGPSLDPSAFVSLVSAALAGQGQHGVVSQLAYAHGMARQRVCALREQGRAALESCFEVGEESAGGFTLRVGEPYSIRDGQGEL